MNVPIKKITAECFFFFTQTAWRGSNYRRHKYSYVYIHTAIKCSIAKFLDWLFPFQMVTFRTNIAIAVPFPRLEHHEVLPTAAQHRMRSCSCLDFTSSCRSMALSTSVSFRILENKSKSHGNRSTQISSPVIILEMKVVCRITKLKRFKTLRLLILCQKPGDKFPAARCMFGLSTTISRQTP